MFRFYCSQINRKENESTLNIINLRIINQNSSEIPLHTPWAGKHQKVEKNKYWGSVGRYKENGHFRRQPGCIETNYV